MDECGIYPMGHHLNNDEQNNNRQTNKRTESDNASLGIISTNGGPMYPNYNSEASRISSFTSWPPGLTQRPQHMAKAGLFYTGRSDQVKCFHCDGGLESWQPEDSPIAEHEKWFPDCTFVRLQKEPVHMPQQQHFERPQQQLLERPPQEFRLEQRNTESDKPELSKDAEVQKEKKRSIPEKKTTTMKVDDMKEEIEKLQNERLCKICWENEISVVFLPCGHLSSCSTCAPAFKDCPICRRRIEQVIKTFLG